MLESLSAINITLAIISAVFAGLLLLGQYSWLTSKEIALLPYKEKNKARVINKFIFFMFSMVFTTTVIYSFHINKPIFGIICIVLTIFFVIFSIQSTQNIYPIFIYEDIKYEIVIIYEDGTMLVKFLENENLIERHRKLDTKILTYDDVTITLSNESIMRKNKK